MKQKSLKDFKHVLFSLYIAEALQRRDLEMNSGDFLQSNGDLK